jgi:Carotenoid biosynthesis protein
MNKALSNNVIWLLVAGYFLWVLADSFFHPASTGVSATVNVFFVIALRPFTACGASVFGDKLRAEQIWRVPLVAAFVMVMWDLTMDPIAATVQKQWIWHDGGSWFTLALSAERRIRRRAAAKTLPSTGHTTLKNVHWGRAGQQTVNWPRLLKRRRNAGCTAGRALWPLRQRLPPDAGDLNPLKAIPCGFESPYAQHFRPRTDCERRVRAASAAIARSSERQRSRAESGEDRERAKG